MTSRRALSLVAIVVAVVSATALALIVSGDVVPSWLRDPLYDFVQPGVAVWWLVLGGPFRTLPASPAGIAFAAAANVAFWLPGVWIVMIVVRTVRRRGADRS